jgi:hypothetical protein
MSLRYLLSWRTSRSLKRDLVNLISAGTPPSLNPAPYTSFGYSSALHAYYSTHAAPGPHNFETLAGIAGLEGKNRRDVKARIIKAHESLKEEGFLTGFQVTGNMIKVDLKPTPSQVRHLARKIARRP